MKKNNYLKIVFLLIASCSFVACSDDAVESTVDTKEWDIDCNIDASYAPGDNFFMYCNGTWHNNVMMDNDSIIGTHLRDNSENKKRIASLSNEPIFKKVEADILSIDKTTEHAYAYISKNIEEVTASISTQEDAWIAISKAIQKGYRPFFDFSFTSEDGEFNVIIEPLANYETVQAVKYLLMKAGVDSDHSAKDAEAIVPMWKKLNDVSHSRDLSIDNLVKHPELREQLVMFSSVKTRSDDDNIVSTILKQLGIDEKHVAIYSDHINFFEDLQQIPADIIKSYLKYIIAKDIWMASHRDMAEYNVTSGANLTLDAVRNTIKEELKYTRSHVYATKFTTPQQKAKWLGLCEELRSTFKERIKKLDWMSPTTKVRAIEKLEAMGMEVGYPNHWIAEGFPMLDNCKSLVEDVVQMRQANYNLKKFFVGKKTKDEGFNFTIAFIDDLTIINAFYNPLFNTILIYPSIMMPPVYDEEASDAAMYACAVALGHEMTHGFDNEGSKYDKLGNYKNWWTVSDQMDYLAKQQLLIDCYNRLEILPNELPGEYADGTKTLSENISDLGGVEIAYQCYVTKLKQQGYIGDEMIKQEKRFFQAFADFWRSKYTAEYALKKRRIDVHSLSKERVNGVVMNCDRWYELYGVKWGNQLYLRPEKRSHIW